MNDSSKKDNGELEQLIEEYNSKRSAEEQAAEEAARSSLKAAPKKAKRRRSAGLASDELSRQRTRRKTQKPESETRTTTAVSEVRSGLNGETARRPSVRRHEKDVIPPLPLNKRISPERLREKQIMNSILASLNSMDDTPEDVPPLAGFQHIEDTKHYDPVKPKKNAPQFAEEDMFAPTRIMKLPAEDGNDTKAEENPEVREPEKKPAPKKKKQASAPAQKKAKKTEPVPVPETAGDTAPEDNGTDSEIEKINRKTAVANAAVCFTLLFGIGIALIVVPRSSGFIQSENRLLAEKPSMTAENLADGSYFTDISKWYTDTIPIREKLKPMSSNFSKLFGIAMDDVKIKGKAQNVTKETLAPTVTSQTEAVTINTDFATTTQATTAPLESTTTTAKKTKKKTETVREIEVPADGEWMGSVVVSGKGKNVRAMSAFYGTFDMGEEYAKVVNKYKDDLDSKVNVYTLNMPSAAAYYMPSNLADQFTSQHDCIKNIGNNLKGVVNIDVFDALDAHKAEYIYSRTDHHWQPLGAYYAAEVFSKTAMFDFPDISTYSTHKIKNFVGTMYAYSDYDEELNKNPDTFIYHKPDNNDELAVTYYDSYFANPQYGGSLFFDYAEGVACYSAILGDDNEIAEIETDVKNGRTLVIIKDSYGNALVPYLTHGFERIYVCDFRYLDVNAIDFIERVGATDVLFAVSLQAAHTDSNIVLINNDRVQEGSPINVATTTTEYQFAEPETETETEETQTEAPQQEQYYDNTADGQVYNEGW